MKKILLFAAALTIAAATAASAGTVARGTLTLGWSNCRVNGGGLSNVTAACTTNSGNGPLLIGGFIGNASSSLNSLNSAFLYVDVFSESAVLDPWWMFTDPPVVGCRPLNTIALDMANNAGATCDRSLLGRGCARRRARLASSTPVRSARIMARCGSLSRWTRRSRERRRRSATVRNRTSSVRASPPALNWYRFVRGCLNKTCLYFAQAMFFQTNLDNFVVGEVGTNIPVPGQAYVGYQLAVGETQCPATAVRNATWGLDQVAVPLVTRSTRKTRRRPPRGGRLFVCGRRCSVLALVGSQL
jgi:hypothetical protein